MFEVLFSKPLECAVWIAIAYFIGTEPHASKWIRFLLWDKLFPPKM